MPAQFLGFGSALHQFLISSIPQDSNNDGLINTGTVTFIGNAGRLEGSPETHGTLVVQALQGAGNVIGSQSFLTGVGAPAEINFSFDNTTPLQSGVPVTFQIQAFGSAVAPVTKTDLTPLTATFTIDTTGPTVTSIGSLVTDDVTNTLSTIDVTFSEPIDLTTLTVDDVTLTYNGTPVSLATPVRLKFPTIDPANPISPTNTVQIAGFRLPTSRAGDYRLTIDATNVADAVGNLGTGSEFVDFSVNGPPANGVVGVAGLLSTASHDFVITEITQDLDNNGRINSQLVEFVGFIERTNRADFTDTHTGISMKPIVNGVVQDAQVLTFGTADFNVDPAAPYRALFRFPVMLDQPATSVEHTETVAFQVIVESRGTLTVLTSADFIATPSVSTDLTATLILDAGPTIASIGPVTSPRNTPVSTVDVTFSEEIDGTTFTAADLALTLDGAPVDVTAATITAINATTFQIGNLDAATTAAGSYVLTVDASQINDSLGSPGSGTETVSFVVDLTRPTVLPLDPIAMREEPVETVVARFSEPINPSTFTTADLQLTRDGVAVPLDPAVVTITQTDATTFVIAGLSTYTTTPGAYRFSVIPGGIQDLAGNAGQGLTQRVYFDIAPGPFVATIGPAAAPSTAAVPSLDIQFSEPIQAATFSLAAVTLRSIDWATYNPLLTPPVLGTELPFGPGVTLTQINDTTFRVGGLTDLTTPAGTYSLTVDASGVTASDGTPFQGSRSYLFSVLPGNGVVGTAAVFKHETPTLKPHHVLINEVSEDLDNNGQINTQSLTFLGQVWRPEPDETDNFTDTHVRLIITAYQQDGAGVAQKIGEVSWDTSTPGTPDFHQGDPVTQPNYAFFRLQANLLSGDSTPQDVTFQITIEPLVPGPRYGTRNIIHYQEFATSETPLTATFVVDTTAPILNPLPPVQSPRTDPVQSVVVTFASPIDPATFGPEDLTLTRDGQLVPLGQGVTITPTDGTNTRFTIGGLGEATTPPGAYVLTVNAAGVSDLAGNAGVGSQPLSFTVVQEVSGPQIVNLQRFGYHSQPTMLVLTFDTALDPATAQNPNNYQVYRPGRDHQIGTADDVLVAISSGVYDPVGRTVTLVMAQRLSIFQTHQLIVRGTGEGAITDTNGNVLDGDGDGTAGGDYVANFGREILAGSAKIQRSVLRARRLQLQVFAPVPKPLNPFAQRLARRRAMLNAKD